MKGQALRYLIVGGVNTLATYVIFILLGTVIDAGLAFTIAFLAGLVWVVFGSSRIVFKAKNSPKKLVMFGAFYLLVYGVGRIIVELIDPVGLLELGLTSLAVLVVTTPLSFFAGRLIFRSPPASP